MTLNRPEARNAMTSHMLGGLVTALAESASSDHRVILLSGVGKDFCAGVDLGELKAARGVTDAAGYAQAIEEALSAIEHTPLPVIAAVKGSALGAGCQMAAACDLVVAAEDARFGIPAARLGIAINYENVERLVRVIGPKRAAEILMAGRTITGTQAVDWRLAAVGVETEALEAASLELAHRVAALAPLSVAASKRGIRAVLGGAGREEFDSLADRAFGSDDLLEGLTAFRERRPPAFEGR
jgi:enoyl-CoA hydratase/carnithine racemase